MTSNNEVDGAEQVVEPCARLMVGFLDAILEVQQFATISAKAMHKLMKAVPLLEALAGIAESIGSDRAKATRDVEIAKADAAYVERHDRDGYSQIHANAVISTWGALESHIDDVLAMLLARDRSLLTSPALQKTKITLAVYESLSHHERVEFLVDSIKNDLNSRFKKGVGQFESIFDAIGLSGPIDDWLRRAFLEFSSVRNVLVHRRGVVDKRLTDNCPWLHLRPGERMRITSSLAVRYSGVAGLYAALVQKRIDARYPDQERSPFGVDVLIEKLTTIVNEVESPVTITASELIASLPQ